MDRNNEYVFYNIEDILTFVEWVKSNFKSTDDYTEWFESSLDYYVPASVFCSRKLKPLQDMHSCPNCGAKFFTPAGLDVHKAVLHSNPSVNSQFWSIINTEYKKENHDPDLSDTD